MINKHRLESALSIIHEDENGRLYSSGHFTNLMSGLHISVATGSEEFREIINHLSYVHQDIWNMETMALRLDWQKGLIAKGELNDVVGSMFAACDIDLFHVQYRSLFDRLAKIIGILSGRPDTLPDSFRKLRDWVNRPENAQRIDERLSQFVTSCDWFVRLRGVRDSIVHRTGRTIVFPEENRILFQVHENYRNTLNIPEIMFNEHIVDFELYAGMLMGYLLSYLEELSGIIEQRISLKKLGGDAQSFHAGLPIIRAWIERAYAIQSDAPANKSLEPSAS